MKPNAFQRLKYSGEFYNFVIEEKGSEIEINYFYSGNIALMTDLDDNQRLNVKTKEPIPIGSLIRNIKDANGNLVLDDMIWQTQSLSPVFDVFNNIIFYRSRASKFQGDLNV